MERFLHKTPDILKYTRNIKMKKNKDKRVDVMSGMIKCVSLFFNGSNKITKKKTTEKNVKSKDLRHKM